MVGKRRATKGGSPRIVIGTSGWNYPAWRTDFYAGVPRKAWLAHCAARFSGLEVNGTFYRRQKPETYRRWRDETPDDFVFAVKGHRAVTHFRKLRGVSQSVAEMKRDLAPMVGKLAAVLWQLPPSLAADSGLLADFATVLDGWVEVRHVVEFRHPSWFGEDTAALLDGHRIGTAISDAVDWARWDEVTGGIAYVRLHGANETYVSEYGTRALRPWASKVEAWRAAGHEVHVYFDNDAAGAAPRDALRLIRMLDDAAD